MEDPIAFDVWMAIAQDKKAEAQRLLRKAKPEMHQLARLQMISKGAVGNEMVLLMEGLGWEEAQSWKAKAETVGAVAVYQSGYGPSDDQRLHRCPIHALRYGGCFGCPVCDGRNRK